MVERTLISFPSQLQLIQRLKHLFYLSSSMVFISGQKGSGKSTLIEQLSNQLPNDIQQAFITLLEPTPIAQLRLKIISQLFTQPLFDADDHLFNSLLLLKDKQTPAKSRVIVIDNVEFLPEQLIKELAEVIQKKSLITENEINFIFLGTELHNNQLVKKIKESVDNKSVTALSFKLPPLDTIEAQQLLNHNLDQVNYSPKVQHQDALAKQLLNCHGIPEKIILLATEVSSGNFEESTPSWMKTRMPAILLMLALVIIAASLASFLYSKFVKPNAEIETVVEIDDFVLDEIASSNLIAKSESGSKSTEALAGKWSNSDQEITDTEFVVGVSDTEERVIISDSQLFDLSQSEGLATIKGQETTLENIDVAPVQESEVADNDSNSDEILKKLDTETDSLNSETISKMVVEDTVVEAAVDNNVLKNAELIEQNEITNSNVEVKGTSLSETIRDAFSSPEMLRAIDPDLYTLQLSGLSSEQSLQAFIEKYQLPQKDVYLYQTIRSGKAWYVIIYGQFESRELAIEAAKNRPAIINKLDTWAKKFASVHQDLTLNEQ